MKKGFTLIELLIVIVIVGILGTIGVGTYGTFVASANNAKTIASTAEYSRAMERYYILNGEYPNPGDIEFYCMGEDPSCGVAALAFSPLNNIEFISTANAQHSRQQVANSRLTQEVNTRKRTVELEKRYQEDLRRKYSEQEERKKELIELDKKRRVKTLFSKKKAFSRNASLNTKIRKAFSDISTTGTISNLPSVSSVKVSDTESWSGLLYRCETTECQSIQIIWVLDGENKDCKLSGAVAQEDGEIDSTRATMCVLSQSPTN